MMLVAGTACVLASCNKKECTSESARETPGTAKICGAIVLGVPVGEAKVYKLIPGYDSDDDFEASGVQYLNGYFYVVFDNRFKIAKIKSTLPINSSGNTLLSSGSGDPVSRASLMMTIIRSIFSYLKKR